MSGEPVLRHRLEPELRHRVLATYGIVQRHLPGRHPQKSHAGDDDVDLDDLDDEDMDDNVSSVADELFGEDWDDLDVSAASVYEGTFGAFRTRVVETDLGDPLSEGDYFSVKGTVSSDGQVVGGFSRTFWRDDDGTLYVRHDILKLNPEVQGQGFASAFNRHAQSWYRRNGIERIELYADEDVGGYAWARAGYDFKDSHARRAVLDRVRASADDLEQRRDRLEDDDPAAESLDALMAEIDALLKSNNPTPFEISELGRARAAPGEVWLGKEILLGSEWDGVRWL